MHSSRQRQAGVTLIELLIVAVMAGILAAVAIPAYRDYAIRGQLTDAQSVLGATRARLEQYYQDNRSYPAACGGTAGGLPTFAMPGDSTYFTYACSQNGGTAGQTFNVDAAGRTGTSTAGFTLRINEQGNRSTVAVPTANGWSLPTNNDCWVIKKPNRC
ncbi:MAG: prepilin-type N-terminal cleavage/methylation domain-containing protein [Burkholderiales bacterium]|nr:prepilin-type N-terminal cleavage/methylation domain-containing protein [Burkholderiales bacterium]